MKEEILKLRAQNKSYNEIRDILGCSKSTVSYHCGIGQKEKTINRQRKYKSITINKLRIKVDTFVGRKFRGNKSPYGKEYKKRDNLHEEIVQKILENPVCYLTGRIIDLENTSSYQIDHKIPYHMTQDNSIENMGLLLKNVNVSKGGMMIDEYFDICKEVLENNGYIVTKK